MMKNLVQNFLLISLFFIYCCVTDFETGTGSIQIVMKPRTSATGLNKTNGELYSVRAILTKEKEEIYNKDLKREGDHFIGRIRDLEEGDDYSLKLYGSSTQIEIAVTAFKAPIKVKPYKMTKVEIEWQSFTPRILFPQHNYTYQTRKRYPFRWTNILSAEWYHLQIAQDSMFLKDYLNINNNNVPVRNYDDNPFILRNELPEGSLYCRIRCQGLEGMWGPWSDIVQFQVDYSDE